MLRFSRCSYMAGIFALAIPVVSHLLLIEAAPVQAAASKRSMTAEARSFFDQGKVQFAAKKYKEAQASFAKACQISSRSDSAQYYLGMAALYAGNHRLFIDCMTRVVVMNKLKNSIIAKNALVNILKYSRLHPYCALNTQEQLCRWDTRRHPVLQICVSQGLALPPQYQGKSLNITEIKEFRRLFQTGTFVQSLVKEPTFKSYQAQNAVSALRKWDWATREGLFKYAFTNDPGKADILVLWTPRFRAGGGMEGLTNYFGTNKPGQGKVIIQLNTAGLSESKGNAYAQLMAAHEFGHAFGLGSHSPGADDIMTAKIYYDSDKAHGISENDKAVLRAVYSLDPDNAW